MRRIFLSVIMLIFCFAMVQADNSGKENSDTKEWVNTIVKRISFSGYAQGGYEYRDQSSPSGQYKISRIILMADAKVTDRINTFMMYDAYANELHELWFNYKFSDAISARFGEFKTPFSLENCLSPTVVEMIDVLSLTTANMIGGANPLMMKGSAGRDYGINVYGKLFKGFLSYDLSLMSGTGRNKMDLNSQKDFVAKIGLHPIEGLTVSGSLLKGTGNLEDVHLDGTGKYVSNSAPISGLKHNGNYQRDRYAVGFEWKSSPVNLRSEYMFGKDGDDHSKGVYATGSVNNVGIKHLDVVASYDYVNVFSGQTRRYTGGLQYWFYPKCRISVTYGHSIKDFLPNENVILSQIQIRF